MPSRRALQRLKLSRVLDRKAENQSLGSSIIISQSAYFNGHICLLISHFLQVWVFFVFFFIGKLFTLLFLSFFSSVIISDPISLPPLVNLIVFSVISSNILQICSSSESSSDDVSLSFPYKPIL